ncbi:MAG: aminopeptidase P family protein [Clostridium sp.]|uniref:aminopeptidase P family protein n=1 Tax=Clostridium sp. DSM 8431 TaxID=1761781 RepID=UPI0008E9C998|nr:aminopeptidase P family protein [Clostridium sp. DSM 8431]MCR4945052.1 aminopeptidase P family protein [Clostridium sp.]SFU75461.1 aminopeptidase P Metallo peptidase. MEROPS family M24B [Clostridium sp. DSM 8431]
MNNTVYKNNREKLMKTIEDNSIVILFAGNAPKKSADEAYQFTPNRNFYYFTGIEEEEHIAVFTKINGEVKEYIYLKEIDEEMERWVGKSLRTNEASEISGIENAAYKDGFELFLNRLFSGVDEMNVYLDMERDSFNSLNNIVGVFAKDLVRKYPFLRIKNVYPRIVPLRKVKTKEEIEEMQKAIKITIEGVNSLMKNAKAGMKEYELEAYFDFVCKKDGAKDFAFKTIAAAGKNAATLHYVDNNSEMKDGDLILFDLGAQWNYYNADITRTFPVNGKFTKRQKEVYEAVLRVNEECIKMLKPGVKFLEWNKQARDMIAEECIKLGLIDKKEDVTKYYWHSIGHGLGLDTHDIDRPDRNTVFEEGMVWTVEPGIYIEEESIGIRIEDDVLITKDGSEVLTKDMIKSVEDIEEFMSEK